MVNDELMARLRRTDTAGTSSLVERYGIDAKLPDWSDKIIDPRFGQTMGLAAREPQRELRLPRRIKRQLDRETL